MLLTKVWCLAQGLVGAADAERWVYNRNHTVLSLPSGSHEDAARGEIYLVTGRQKSRDSIFEGTYEGKKQKGITEGILSPTWKCRPRSPVTWSVITHTFAAPKGASNSGTEILRCVRPICEHAQ